MLFNYKSAHVFFGLTSTGGGSTIYSTLPDPARGESGAHSQATGPIQSRLFNPIPNFTSKPRSLKRRTFRRYTNPVVVIIIIWSTD